MWADWRSWLEIIFKVGLRNLGQDFRTDSANRRHREQGRPGQIAAHADWLARRTHVRQPVANLLKADTIFWFGFPAESHQITNAHWSVLWCNQHDTLQDQPNHLQAEMQVLATLPKTGRTFETRTSGGNFIVSALNELFLA